MDQGVSQQEALQKIELAVDERVFRAGLIKRAKTEILKNSFGLAEAERFLCLQKQLLQEMACVFELRRQQLEMGRAH